MSPGKYGLKHKYHGNIYTYSQKNKPCPGNTVLLGDVHGEQAG